MAHLNAHTNTHTKPMHSCLPDRLVLHHMSSADMLNVQMLPEWPSASTALRRFLKALCGDRGMKHADNAVKLMCIDFAGQLAGRLCTEALWCESETPWVDGALSEAGVYSAGGVCMTV